MDKSYINGCAGKVQYSNYIAAEYVFNNDHTDTDSNIYKCKHCKKFHIGCIDSKKRKVPKRRNKKFDNEQHKNKIKRFKY